MSELTDLYQEIILDHNKRPRNYRPLENPTHHADGFNPLCGDQFTFYLDVKDDRIADIGFEGEGCAISKASASLMTVHLKGKPLAEVRQSLDAVFRLLTGPEDAAPPPDADLGNVEALSGVRRFPVRVKCATLPWHTLKAALKGKETVSTEAG